MSIETANLRMKKGYSQNAPPGCLAFVARPKMHTWGKSRKEREGERLTVTHAHAHINMNMNIHTYA